jgi:hypothetical protein
MNRTRRPLSGRHDKRKKPPHASRTPFRLNDKMIALATRKSSPDLLGIPAWSEALILPPARAMLQLFAGRDGARPRAGRHRSFQAWERKTGAPIRRRTKSLQTRRFASKLGLKTN